MKMRVTWSDHVRAWPQSGMSKKSYCLKHGLSYPLFFYYQKQILNDDASVGFDQILVPVQSSVAEANLKIHFSNGTIMFFPEHLLDRVVDLIQNRSAC
jgi:hypothetical protein